MTCLDTQPESGLITCWDSRSLYSKRDTLCGARMSSSKVRSLLERDSVHQQQLKSPAHWRSLVSMELPSRWQRWRSSASIPKTISSAPESASWTRLYLAWEGRDMLSCLIAAHLSSR